MFYEALGQTTGLEIMKHTVKSSMMIWKRVLDIVEDLATAQTKEETTSSLTARELGAPTTVGNHARSPQRWWWWWYT
jgi:hypothetical protein